MKPENSPRQPGLHNAKAPALQIVELELPDCQKSLAEFAPAGANKVKIIFSGGVYVGENTFRPASVEFLR